MCAHYNYKYFVRIREYAYSFLANTKHNNVVRIHIASYMYMYEGNVYVI